ncbi:hypothetical protein [Megamonas funiformis]|uniref:Uncharacterized protein n=1 Tax=Siphoviridae sp. ctmAU6 TaxID=2826451 RepID=A0A8S5MFC0_9CAUD|nr:MAG TPA: hypothetical protein [Siphoviridae sp. ctmAU6]
MDKDPLEIAYQDLNIHDIVEGRWRNIKYINPDARYLGNARVELVVVVDMTVNNQNKKVKRYYTKKGTVIGELDIDKE